MPFSSDPESEETYTADIQVDVLDNGVEIKAPAVFFEGERAQVQFPDSPSRVLLNSEQLLVEDASESPEFWVVPQLAGTDDAEQLNVLIQFDIDDDIQNGFQAWSRPIYQYPIELGDPLTLKSGDDLTILANLSDSFLDSEKDAFASFEWKQVEGPNITTSNADNASLSLTLPDVAEITRLRFQLSTRTIKGKIFRKEKIVFVVPDNAWVAATHIDQGAGNAVVAREDGSIVHFSLDGELTYSGSPFTNLKQLEDGTPLWALAETGELKWFNANDQWQSPLQDIPEMAKLFGIYGDVRSGTQMIDKNGNIYLVSPGSHNFSAHDSQAVAVSHRYVGQHILLENGELQNFDGIILTDGIAEISHYAFRTTEGKIGAYSNQNEINFLSEFDQHADFMAVAAPKIATVKPPMPVFALRNNGDVIASTPKAPPAPNDLVEITTIEVGGKLAIALKQDGTVIQWRSAVLIPDEINAVLKGEKPSPFNIRETYY